MQTPGREMFAIGIEFLGGRYVATAYNDRNRAEWPPHPARLFSALVATWAEWSGQDEDGRPSDQTGAGALVWLAGQPPPRILASGGADVAHRSVVTVFVPVNDVAVVSPPDRGKLDEALGVMGAAEDPKAHARAGKAVAKLEEKLLDVTVKAIAAPAKFAKGDAAAGAAVLPESRTRQARTFPSVTPKSARVGFVWPSAQPEAPILAALGDLLTRLVRLGHSSSLVAGRLLQDEDVKRMADELTTYREEQDGGAHVIRWVSPQQMGGLAAAFDLYRETEPRVLPAVFTTYDEGEQRNEDTPPTSIFDPTFLVLVRTGGPRLPITAVPGLSRQLRRALMAALGADVPELLSGHKTDGSPTERPHVAIVPLPVVGGLHADGALLGVALVFPRDAQAAERRRVLAALATLGRRTSPEDAPTVHLHLGRAGTVELQLSEWGQDSRRTLQVSRWSRPSRHWLTATPVALDRNPGDLHDASPAARAAAFAEAEASIAVAVERIGLPRPRAIEVLRSSVLGGSAKPRAYGRFPADPNKAQRVLVHARIAFEDRVRGPVLVGAGRYQGMGLFVPDDDAGEASQ